MDALELEDIRRDAEEELPDECQLLRATRVVTGGESRTTFVPGPIYRGRLAPGGLTPSEKAIAERLGVQLTWRVTLPVAANIRPTDRLRILGRTLEVIAPLGPRSLEITRKVICKDAP